MSESKRYEVVIIGGGVTGTAIAFVLSQFTNVRSVALVEKYERVATVNSSPSNNSQTLHFGDIETNYSLKKALPIKEAAEMMRRFVEDIAVRIGDRSLYQVTPKMVLAVGQEEVETLRQRYEEFSAHYPGLEFLEGIAQIAKYEPMLVYKRDVLEPIAAMVTQDGYAINYQMLSEMFVYAAQQCGKTFDEYFNREVEQIVQTYRAGKQIFRVETDDVVLEAPVVVVAAGPFSLRFAQEMGIGKHLGIMPVAGSFYFAGDILASKVYTMQKDGLPFAAVHGDPDVVEVGQTRFGPTAKMLPLLERHKYRSMRGFFRRPVMSIAGVLALLSILRDRVVAKFLLENFFYDVPIVGKWLFLRKARKIVPSLKYRDLKLGKDLGGIRPQVVDTRERKMQMGESKLANNGIIFNTTPSPGASNALANAERDAKALVMFLNERSADPKGKRYKFFQDFFDKIYRN